MSRQPIPEPTPKARSRWLPHDIPNFLVGLATLVTVIFYTNYASQQVTETQNANTIAKKALAEANKPYVGLVGIYPNFTKDTAGKHLRIGFVVINNGNTPASNLKFTNCDPIIKDGDLNPLMTCNVSETSSSDNVLGPKQSIQYVGPIIKQDDLDATQDGKKSIFILGYVTYKDNTSFGEGAERPRITRFCSRVVKPEVSLPANAVAPPPQSDPNRNPDLPIVMGMGCPSFNCTDDACSK